MQTRSKSISKTLAVNIDFDEASKAWRSNKRSLGNGTYEYVKQSSSRLQSKNANSVGKKVVEFRHAYNTRSTLRESC
jgi:hypothetical protein